MILYIIQIQVEVLGTSTSNYKVQVHTCVYVYRSTYLYCLNKEKL